MGSARRAGIDPDKFQAIVDAGPYLGKEAVDAKLVDGVAYRDEVYGQVKTKAGSGAELFIWTNIWIARAGRISMGRKSH